MNATFMGFATFVAMWREIYTLLRKDLQQEWRLGYALGSVLLYVLSTVFVVYMAFQNITPQVWMVMLWIIMIFSTTHAVSKGFMHETGRNKLFYYQLAKPESILVSKLMYHLILTVVLSTVALGALSLVATCPIMLWPVFIPTFLLGCIGLAIIFTFISAIAAQAGQQSTFIAILGFPLILPILLLGIQLSAHAIGLIEMSSPSNSLYLLLALNLGLLGLTLILFPSLWKD